MIQESVAKLVQYGLTTGLIEKEDAIYTANRLLDLLNMDTLEEETEAAIMDTAADEAIIGRLEKILGDICDYAYDKGIIEENTVGYRDLFDTKVMSLLVDRPSISSINLRCCIRRVRKSDRFLLQTQSGYGLYPSLSYCEGSQWLARRSMAIWTSRLICPSRRRIRRRSRRQSSRSRHLSEVSALPGKIGAAYTGRLNHPARGLALHRALFR